MTTVFVISDTHFGHANILKFSNSHGRALRPEFATVEEMNEHMIERWNSVVRPQDHVYHLGDVAFGQEGMKCLRRLNGHKRLVRGNHDIYSDATYRLYFEKIYGVRVWDDMIMSHIPLHPDSIKEKWTNVHGHLHNNQPQGHLGVKYYNVSVEMIDYTPISLEELRERIKEQQYHFQGRMLDEDQSDPR